MTKSSDILFGHHPGNISMDSNQAGATMSSRYTTAKGALIAASAVIPGSAFVKGGRVVGSSQAVKYYGYAKRPILSVGVHKKITGAQTAMALSKGYSKALITMGILDIGRNVRLAYQREYTRLGINLMGPPGSLFLYNNYMRRNKTVDDLEVIEEGSPRDFSLTSESKTGGKSTSYYLGKNRIWAKGHDPCAKGYRLKRMNNAYYCVKQ